MARRWTSLAGLTPEEGREDTTVQTVLISRATQHVLSLPKARGIQVFLLGLEESHPDVYQETEVETLKEGSREVAAPVHQAIYKAGT